MSKQSDQSSSARKGGSLPQGSSTTKDLPLHNFPIAPGWDKGCALTKETILEEIKKTQEKEQEQEEEYRRLTSDFEVE